eukprot:scaffold1926_cov122-Isochrysis_galbana.AAC.2
MKKISPPALRTRDIASACSLLTNGASLPHSRAPLAQRKCEAPLVVAHARVHALRRRLRGDAGPARGGARGCCGEDKLAQRSLLRTLAGGAQQSRAHGGARGRAHLNVTGHAIHGRPATGSASGAGCHAGRIALLPISGGRVGSVGFVVARCRARRWVVGGEARLGGRPEESTHKLLLAGQPRAQDGGGGKQRFEVSQSKAKLVEAAAGRAAGPDVPSGAATRRASRCPASHHPAPGCGVSDGAQELPCFLPQPHDTGSDSGD